MLALWQATLASMFAPGLALRGPPGSMDMAVNQLIEEYRGAMRLFVISIFLFMTTALLWCAPAAGAARPPPAWGSRGAAACRPSRAALQVVDVELVADVCVRDPHGALHDARHVRQDRQRDGRV